MYISRKRKANRTKSGIVYVLKIELPFGSVYKIGTTGRRKVEPRMFEVLAILMEEYGFVPKTTVMMKERTKDNYRAEAMLHKRFSENRYEFDREFSTSSEYFTFTDEEYEMLVLEYAEVMELCKSKEISASVNYCPITGEVL